MKSVWQIVRNYIWWSYERGSIHYDIMVTLIVAFIFLAPLKVDFKDKPQEAAPHPNRMVVSANAQGGWTVEVDPGLIAATDDAGIEAGLRRAVLPLSENVKLVRWERVTSPGGRLIAYRAWIKRVPEPKPSAKH